MAGRRDQRPTTVPWPVKVESCREDVADAFEKYCKYVKESLSIEQIREILEANGLDSSGSDAALLRRCQDVLFFGPLEKCPVCNANNLEFTGCYCECGSCIYRSKYPPRKQGHIKFPVSILKHFNPNFDPVYWTFKINQGFVERFLWGYRLEMPNPEEGITVNIYQDEVEINGRRMSKRILSICVVVFVIFICFSMVYLFSKI